MKSLYKGRCATCGKPIVIGETIEYRGKGDVHHTACFYPVETMSDDEADALADRLNFYAKGKVQ